MSIREEIEAAEKVVKTARRRFDSAESNLDSIRRFREIGSRTYAIKGKREAGARLVRAVEWLRELMYRDADMEGKLSIERDRLLRAVGEYVMVERYSRGGEWCLANIKKASDKMEAIQARIDVLELENE